MRMEPEHALRGHDGRVVYADRLAANVYARLTPSMRTEVRAMIENDWQGALELRREDLNDLGIVGGEFRISDCVARCSLYFGGTEEHPKVVIEGRQSMIDGAMPETVMTGLAGRDLADIVGNEIARGLTVVDAGFADGITTIRHLADSAFLVDEMAAPFTSRPGRTRNGDG